MKTNPISDLKILTCYDKILEILKGKIIVPRTLEFFISDACNHNCIGCHSSMLHRREKSFLEHSTAIRVLSEASEMGILGLELAGGGEPLMHPQIISIIQFAHNRGMKVGMFTNGILLNRHKNKELVKNLKFIRIGLDAGSTSTYKKIHRKDEFKILLKNIRELKYTKEKEKSDLTIGTKYLISKLNYKEIGMGIKISKDLGVDYIQFKLTRNNPYELNSNLAEIANEKINEAKNSIKNEKFLILSSIRKTKINKKCYLHQLHPTIDADGNLYICAFFQHRMDSMCIGNVYHNSFTELWYSQKHRETMEKIIPEECNYYDCPLHIYTELTESYIINDEMHLEFV